MKANQNNNSMDAEIKKMNEGIISGNEKERKEAADKLFESFVSRWSGRIALTPENWNKLNNEAKWVVIRETFEHYPGEPLSLFETLDYRLHVLLDKLLDELKEEIWWRWRFDEWWRYAEWYADPLSIIMNLLNNLMTLIYVPSEQVLNLLDVIKQAGDEEFEEIMNKMIENRKKLTEKTREDLIKKLIKKAQALPNEIIGGTSEFSNFVSILDVNSYRMTQQDAQYVSMAINKFADKAMQLQSLPKIVLSFDPPPFLVRHPHLASDYFRRSYHGKTEERSEKRYSEGMFDIEQLLGLYLSHEKKIVLYLLGIRWAAEQLERRMNKSRSKIIEDLTTIVLVHEIGHWITHQMPTKNYEEWEQEYYDTTSENVHEGWAQLITYWCIQNNPDLLTTFQELNRNQSAPYHQYKDFVSYPENNVIASLDELRGLERGALVQDWKDLIMKVTV